MKNQTSKIYVFCVRTNTETLYKGFANEKSALKVFQTLNMPAYLATQGKPCINNDAYNRLFA